MVQLVKNRSQFQTDYNHCVYIGVYIGVVHYQSYPVLLHYNSSLLSLKYQEISVALLGPSKLSCKDQLPKL